jgi:uncharacterized repeat protein (TIGR01451 family)
VSADAGGGTTAGENRSERRARWAVGTTGALLAVALGALFANAVLLAAAVVPLVFVAYGALSSIPADSAVSIERSVSPDDPGPGERVTVELTVENTGGRTLADVRAVDGVPDELAVVSGTPRLATALRPGSEATTSYEVVARRGDHPFEPVTVRTRSLAAARRATGTVAATGDERVVCANAVSGAGIREATLPRTGTLPTDTGGSGVEFHSTRDYQSGDPINRIDWRRYARTTDLTTVQFREEHSMRVVVVVDARSPGMVVPQAGYPTGAELAAYAGERLHDVLRTGGHAVAVTAVGLSDADVDTPVPGEIPWVGTDDRRTEAAATDLFRAVGRAADRRTDDATGDRMAADGGGGGATAGVNPGGTAGVMSGSRRGTDTDARDRLLARLPPDAVVVVCTPALDDWPVDLVQQLAVRGYSTVTVSPDVTGAEGGVGVDTPGAITAGLDRQVTLQRLGRGGAAVVDWSLAEPLGVALRLSLRKLFDQA